MSQETEESGEVNAELLEAHIVAQAITELQEIQAPAAQTLVSEGGDVVLNGDVEGDIQGVPGQTHVIYYIEDGAIARTEDRTLVDSSVQANDYEIERRSGKVPARKRVIPFKFRDYKNNSYDEDSDSDYDPHEYLSTRTVKKAKVSKPDTSSSAEKRTKTKVDGMRRLGRPRKHYYPSQTGISTFHDEAVSNEVEKMYQEALQLTQNELLAGQTEGTVGDVGVSEVENREENTTKDTSTVVVQKSETENTEGETEKVKVDDEQSKYMEHSHRMTTRGKRVPVYGEEYAGGALYGRGKGRPRMSKLPFYKCAECGKTFKQKAKTKESERKKTGGGPQVSLTSAEDEVMKVLKDKPQMKGINGGIESSVPSSVASEIAATTTSVESVEDLEATVFVDQEKETSESCGISTSEGSKRGTKRKRGGITSDDELYQLEKERAKLEIELLRLRIKQEKDLFSLKVDMLNESREQDKSLFSLKQELLSSSIKNALDGGNLKSHLRLHIAGTAFHCNEEGCEKSYRSNESLRRHLLTHQGIKPFQCEMCEQRFSSNVALTEHISRHLNERPYVCNHCQKSFRQVSCFKRHVATHSGILPFSCSICHKRFALTAYLKSHMKVHTGEKPFQCTVCFKRFAHQSDVKRHSTTHTGAKPYSCGKCQAKFSDVSSKNRHEREHENNKRYTCTLCNDTFKRAGQLRSHLNKKHSLAIAVTIGKDSSNGMFTFKSVKEGEGCDSNFNNLSQQRIVSLIKNLHSKAIPNEGIIENVHLNEIEIGNQSNEIVLPAENVTDISQLEKEVDASMIEGDIQVPIELQGVEIQEDGNGQTFIAIADLAESLSVAEKDISGGQIKYRVLCEIDENGEQKQILVPFNPTEVEEESLQIDYSTESMVPNCVSEETTATETIIETIDSIPEIHEQDGVNDASEEKLELLAENNTDPKQKEVKDSEKTTDVIDKPDDHKDDVPVTVASGIDYVNCPDFSKQEYYNWLTNFTEFCKVVPMPLDVSLFQKISQVHKTLSDVMATPYGVVADKENFRVLMNISKELSTIINEHLVYVLENLNGEEKQEEGYEIVENE